jgi:DNA-binding PucR family transcriptional regulator
LIDDLVRHNADDKGEGRATLEMVARVSDYVDRVVEQLVVEYAKAREEWLNPNAIFAARVRSVLYDKRLTVDEAQTRLGHRLRRQHLALEVWQAPTGKHAALRDLAAAIASAAGCAEPDIVVLIDDRSASVWLPCDTPAALDTSRMSRAVAAIPATYAAIGEVGFSLDGFRRSHEQALSAKAVAQVRDPPRERVTPYAAVAPIAPMTADLVATRAWVTETLGGLAVDDERHGTLRETLRVFFDCDGSHTATAQRLGVHRNTIQYRIHKAEELRGRSLRLGRLDLELALLASFWFGSAVLEAD